MLTDQTKYSINTTDKMLTDQTKFNIKMLICWALLQTKTGCL